MAESTAGTSQNNSSYSNNSCSDAGVSMFDQTSTITDPLESILLPRQFLNALPFFLNCLTRAFIISTLYFYEGPQDVAALFAMQAFLGISVNLVSDSYIEGAVQKTMVSFQKQRRSEGNTILLYIFATEYIVVLIIAIVCIIFMRAYYGFVVTFSTDYYLYFSITIYVESLVRSFAYSTDSLLVLDNNAGLRILISGLEFVLVPILAHMRAFSDIGSFKILLFAESVVSICFAILWILRIFAVKRRLLKYRSTVRVKLALFIPIRWNLFIAGTNEIATSFLNNLFIPLASCFVVYLSQRDINAQFVELNLFTNGFMVLFWDLSLCLCNGWMYYMKAVLNSNKTMDRYDRIWVMLTKYFFYFVIANCIYTAIIHVITKPIMRLILNGNKEFSEDFIEYAFGLIRPVSLLAFFAPPVYFVQVFCAVHEKTWWIVLPLHLGKYIVLAALLLIVFLTDSNNFLYSWIIFYPLMVFIILGCLAMPLVYKKLMVLRKEKQESVELADLGVLHVDEVKIDTFSELNVEINDLIDESFPSKLEMKIGESGRSSSKVILANQESAIRFSTSVISQERSLPIPEEDVGMAEQDRILQFLAKE